MQSSSTLSGYFHFVNKISCYQGNKSVFFLYFNPINKKKSALTMDRAVLEINPPRDKLNIIFFILLLHGVGTLMPWNMFINARDVSFV